MTDSKHSLAIRNKIERYEEELMAFKSEGFDAAAILLVDDVAIRVIAVWPHIVRSIEDAPVGSDVWGYVNFDISEWMHLADTGLTGFDFGELVDRLKTLRLIYPDGTLPEEVRQHIIYRLSALGVTNKKE